MQSPRGIIYFLLLAATFWPPAAAFGAAEKPENPRLAAASELTAQDLAKIQKIFNDLAETFLTANLEPARLDKLPAGSASNLEKEFSQATFLDFRILEIRPDDTWPKNLHTVAVSLAYTLIPHEDLPQPLCQQLLAFRTINPASPERQQQLAEIVQALIEEKRHEMPLELLAELLEARQKLRALDSASPARRELMDEIWSLLDEAKLTVSCRICQTFVLHKHGNSVFRIVRSPFFESFGQRKGIGLLATQMLLAAILGLALLSFWIWMGSAAFRLRPRSTFWRIFVFIPLLGTLVFFACSYLPAFLRGIFSRRH
jgi:hypothetical protein